MSIEELVKQKYHLESHIKPLSTMLGQKTNWLLMDGSVQHCDVRSFTEEAVRAHRDMLETQLTQVNNLLEKAYRYLENQGDV